MSRNKVLLMILVVLMGVSLACSGSTSNSLSNAAQASTQDAGKNTAAPTDPPAAEKPAATDAPTEVAEPTQPEPTQVPVAQAVDLKLTGIQGFVQDDIHVVSVFMVENPNADQAIESSEYQIAVYDDAGTVLKSDSGYLSLVLPGETTAIVSESYLEKGQKASKVEVQLSSGDASVMEEKVVPYTTDQVKFIPDQYFPKVTGVIKNGLNRNISNMHVMAVAYDQSGAIIGGGYTYLNFLPASGQAPVDVSMLVDGTPDKVEIYPGLSGLSDFEEVAAGSDVVRLVTFGFGQDDTQVAVGFIVENPAGGSPIEGTEYQVGIYDEAGNVLDSESGYVNLIFPGEKQAVVATGFVPDGKKAAKVDVQINPGSESSYELKANPFTTDQVQYAGSGYFPKVTGLIKNSYSQQIKNVEVYALAYDDQGNIIGGGYTYLDFIPAGASAAADVSVTVSGKPAKVELFPQLTSMSEFE
jgi:hypothetical protein